MKIEKVLELAKELNLDYEIDNKDYYFYLPAEWVLNGENVEEDEREAFFVWDSKIKKVIATFNIVVDADLCYYYNDSVDYSIFEEFEPRARRFYCIISQLQEMRKKLAVQMNIEKIKQDFN